MTDNLIDIIRQHRIPKVILRFIIMNFLDLSTINNLLLTVKEMNVLDNYSKDLIAKSTYGFIWNCENGHLTVAQWLYSFGDGNIHQENEYAFRLSCQNGHLTVVQWLYSLGDVNIHQENEYAFRLSCQNGNLTVAQWLYSLGDVNIHQQNEYAFRLSCANGHLTVAQWLYSLGDVNIHATCENYEHAFKLSCKNGHLTVAQWLYSIHCINIYANYEYAFRLSCENGHLVVAKWLYSFGNLNIHVNNEYAFGLSCENGHLAVAKWLYSLGEKMDRSDPSSLAQGQCEGIPLGRVDIHADDEYAFRWSCINGHLAVAKWLYSLGEEMDRTDPVSLAHEKQDEEIDLTDSRAGKEQCRINIHAYNDSVFKYAKKNILDWLNNLL